MLASSRTVAEALSTSRFISLIGVTAVLFFLALLPFEIIPEIPVDIDAKPFFVPLALAALIVGRGAGLGIGLGVALGEGLRDLMEGYELDDPIGFIGYVIGFWVAAKIFQVAPGNRLVLVVGSVVCAFIQAAVEASSFLLFGSEALTVAIVSTFGNTVSHGIIFGAIPLFFLIRALEGRFEAHLGFAPRGSATQAPLPAPENAGAPSDAAVAGLARVSLRYPGLTTLSIEDASVDIMPGEVIALAGAPGQGKKSIALALSGIAPEATGGERVGTVKPAAQTGWLGAHPREFVTQARVIHEVAVAAGARQDAGSDKGDAFQIASDALSAAGFPAERHRDFIWQLSEPELLIVQIAALWVRRPRLLVIDGGAVDLLDDVGRDDLARLIAAQREIGAVIVLASRPSQLLPSVDRALWVEGGRVTDAFAAGDPELAKRLDAAPRAGTVEVTSGAAPRVPVLHSRHDGWWKKRDPRVKWTIFIALIAFIYIAPDWRWMAALTAIGCAVVITARPRPVWLVLALFVQMPNVIGLVLLPLLGEGAATGDEFAFGLRLAFGWIAAILFGVSLISTMEIPEMVSGLRGIGLPQRFAFVVGYAFVLIYLSLADLAHVLDRMREEGLAFRWETPQRSFRAALALFVPVIETVARRGGALSVALAVNNPRLAMPPLQTSRVTLPDILLLAVTSAALAGATSARLSL